MGVNWADVWQSRSASCTATYQARPAEVETTLSCAGKQLVLAAVDHAQGRGVFRPRIQGVDPLKSQDAFRLFEDDRVLVGARSMGKCRQHKIQQRPVEPRYNVGECNLLIASKGCRDHQESVLTTGKPVYVLGDGLEIDPAPALLIAVHPWPARLGEAPVKSTEKKFCGGFAGEGASCPFT